jgi:hypothetical protein
VLEYPQDKRRAHSLVLSSFTEAELFVRDNFPALVSEWSMYPADRLEAFGVRTNWLLFTNAEGLEALGIDRYRKRFTDAEQRCMIPLFQLEMTPERRLVPTLVVQNVNRILGQTRTVREIAIWWLAAHDLLSKFPDSQGQFRQDVSPRMALLDARLSQGLIGAANDTVDRDMTLKVERVPRLALT